MYIAHNTHHMVTHAKNGVYKSRVCSAIVETNFAALALASHEWNGAMTDEYLALMKNDTWYLINLPPDRKSVGCKWIFKLKQNADGYLNTHNARLVAQEYGQIARFDYNETFSQVAKPTIIHITLIVALSQSWHVRQLDVKKKHF